MHEITMKYGNENISFKIENAKSIQTLEAKNSPTIENIKEYLYKEVEENAINSKALSTLLNKEDKVTIIISDITRLWSRQDLVCKALVEFLNEKCAIPFENMVILVALGTHRPQSEEENRKTVSDFVYDKVEVVSHDCLEQMEYVGTTSFNTPVWVNPLAVNRKVIVLSSTVHHLMSGYGGARKSILPGISGKETILKNHIMALHEFEARSSDKIGIGITSTNPINNDMNEATALVNPIFGINIVINKEGKHSQLLCGHWLHAWEKSCEIVNNVFGVPIKEKADIVIASCGGFPKDINLYQGVKTLLNMGEAVKDGGTMIFLAQCPEGGGAPDFFSWASSLKTNSLDKDLRANFTIGGYIFYAALEVIKKGQVLALTELDDENLKDMNIKGFTSIESLLKEVDFTAKTVYLMPSGGNTVPISI